MWINDVVYAEKEIEIIILTDKKDILYEAEIQLKLNVFGELNYSNNPEEFSLPDIEIESLYLTVNSFHKKNDIKNIVIKDFSIDITVQTDNFEKLIEDYVITYFPSLKLNNIHLNGNKLEIRYERKNQKKIMKCLSA